MGGFVTGGVTGRVRSGTGWLKSVCRVGGFSGGVDVGGCVGVCVWVCVCGRVGVGGGVWVGVAGCVWVGGFDGIKGITTSDGGDEVGECRSNVGSRVGGNKTAVGKSGIVGDRVVKVIVDLVNAV